MPLLKGKKNIGKNITELKKAGRPYRVARSIALKTAYGKKKKKKKIKRLSEMI